MVDVLVDTSVVVDILRNYPNAVDWLREQRGLGISRAAILELIQGARDKRSYRAVIQLVGQFEIVETTIEDLIWTTEQLPVYLYRYGVDAFDCMIAASSRRLGLPLYTRNLKHFVPILGASAVIPY